LIFQGFEGYCIIAFFIATISFHLATGSLDAVLLAKLSLRLVLASYPNSFKPLIK